MVLRSPLLRLIVGWLCTSLALFVAAAVVPEISYGSDLGTLLLAGAILGLANFALRPLVIFMTLPAIVLSFGIALLFVNALMLWFTAAITPDLKIGGFWSTLAGALLIWLVNLVLRPISRSRHLAESAPRAHTVPRW